MSTLSIKNIRKVYPNDVEAVKDFSLEVEDKEFVVFVGPSGCGKSTTLRMIAGLEEITDGILEIDGQIVNEVEPKDRDIAMVFQNYALYPHMTVYENMAFSLRMKKMPKSEIDKAVKEAARILDLGDLLTRKPKALSGGQRQRVAMGRAIVRNPKVFLMDEPLSNLDAKLRVQMRMEIAKLHQRLGATIIYVTHDQIEAMALGTRIVVMEDGLVQQIDTPQNLYNNPRNVFVAGFIGSPKMNFLDGAIIVNPDGICLRIGEDRVQLPCGLTAAESEPGSLEKEVLIGIRPEDIYLAGTPKESFPCITIEAKISMYELIGAETFIYFDAGGAQLTARVSSRISVQRGDAASFVIDISRIHIFDKETSLRIAVND